MHFAIKNKTGSLVLGKHRNLRGQLKHSKILISILWGHAYNKLLQF